MSTSADRPTPLAERDFFFFLVDIGTELRFFSFSFRNALESDFAPNVTFHCARGVKIRIRRNTGALRGWMDRWLVYGPFLDARVFCFLGPRRVAPQPPLFWCTCRRRRQRVQAIAIASVSDSPRNFPARKIPCGATSEPALFFYFFARKNRYRAGAIFLPSKTVKRLDSIQL